MFILYDLNQKEQLVQINFTERLYRALCIDLVMYYANIDWISKWLVTNMIYVYKQL